MAPSGIIAVLAGWYVVEVGRQPWLVQGLVRTMDVVSPLPPERVLLSLSLFVITYSLLFGVYLYFFRKLIKKGPPSLEELQQLQIGVKGSGYGRESGFQAMYDYTRPKTVWVNTSSEPMANPFVMR